jgi:putative membrane protein
MPPEVPKSSNELAQDRTELAVQRTLMAASRSLMAWVRTGLSMIGFGFTIYKFLSAEAQGVARDPRNVGLFLISLGILSILFGAIEYRQTVGDLRRNFGGKFRKYPLILAALVGGVGASFAAGSVVESGLKIVYRNSPNTLRGIIHDYSTQTGLQHANSREYPDTPRFRNPHRYL